MAISFACEHCGKPCKVPNDLAGRTGRCGGCGQMMTIPGTRVAGAGRGMGTTARVVLGLVISVPVMAVLAALLLPAIQAARQAAEAVKAKNEALARGEAVPPPAVAPGGMPRAASADAPLPLPPFPDRGPGREIEPGVIYHEIVLGPPSAPPGQGGKLGLYLPSGEHAEGSLPCILITTAGTNLLTGITLGGDEDHLERIPYARAGFAVLAFELDGPQPQPVGGKDPSPMVVFAAMRRFLAARAGLVNARVAFEYVLAKLPEVDPGRISIAGHSSAGTLALLFAEHEPRLESCVAFAPAVDLEKRFGPEAVGHLRQAKLADLATRYSPKLGEARLDCPLFLFHARDDGNLPVAESEAFAARLQALGKAVTLDLVDDGDHYQSMIDQGIPRAIAWLKGTAPAEK